MARLARVSTTNNSGLDPSPKGSTSSLKRPHEESRGLTSPSPAASFSSDKENHTSETAGRHNKGRSKGMAPLASQTPRSHTPATTRTDKRRRLGERDATRAEDRNAMESQLAHERELEEAVDTKFYDPDQDPEERRAIRKGLRDLARNLNDSRAEFLTPGDNGLVRTIEKANNFFPSVKQTSDAVLDSRLLVSAADLSNKKITQLNLGNSVQGVDVDEFVSKCITFMRQGPSAHHRSSGAAPSSSQRRRQRRRDTATDDVDDDASDADANSNPLDWALLGRQACFPHNVRPPVPGFLLGPLSLQKRARLQRTRRERLQQRNPAEMVRPEELKAADLEKVENSNLTILCTRIREALVRVQRDGEAAVEAQATDDTSEAEVKALMEEHGICDDSGVNFFRFIVHPKSFGQTVENLFYVSFLIRDGSVGVGEDGDGLPTLHATEPRPLSDLKQQGVQKYQAVFNLDFKTWRDLIDAFDITEPMIADRTSVEGEGGRVGVKGWYG